MKSPSRIPSSIPYLHRWLSGPFLRYACVSHEGVVARMVMPNETGGVLEQRF